MRFRKHNTSLILAALILFTMALPAAAQDLPPAPDYSSEKNWISLPKTIDRPADVFWFYPTVYNGDPIVAPVDDPQMREGAQYTLDAQAGVFTHSANIFAPLYRQSNISVLSMDPDKKESYLAAGFSDVVRAFEYYIENLNQGRPFILAGHSQGSNLMTRLLKQKLSDPDLRKRMVAAYVIGWSVTKDDLEKYPFLHICRQPRQTGCIITYNSVADGAQDKAPTILPGSVVVNPLSWTVDDKAIPASKNLGAVFFDRDGNSNEAPHFTSAQAKNGGLAVAPADPDRLDDFPFGPGIYHTYDYTFFYRNLEANVAERIKAFLAKEL